MTEVDDTDVQRKTWATLAARAAMHGWSLWRSDAADGPLRWFLGRHGLVRLCADAAEVDRLLDEVGV